MKISIEWLKDFTPVELEPKTICDGLTLSGSKVESCDTLGEEIQLVITGKITSISKHPDADKLVICKVDAGDRLLQIVTGAPNVHAGDIVPVALDGSRLPGGVQIRTGQLRGQLSEGMLCSVAELGCTTADFPAAAADGIFLLPPDTPVGRDIRQVLHLNDVVIDFEITSNRVDCFAAEGLGRETAITFNLPFQPIDPQVQALCPEKSEGLAKVAIEAPDLCYRYCGRVVRNIKVGPSPEWLRRRLRCAGMRPINNIVDITNYVMLELGQPMHAFDLEQLAGRQILVRRALTGEKMRTLDSVDHQLDSSMLVIADQEKAVAIAGVMGAENSEITSSTQTILFESATFNPVAVRKTAKKVGLRTEASSRFEKGLDVNNARRALDRACELVEQLAAGQVCQGVIDAWPVRPEPLSLTYNPVSINSFLGTNIDADWMGKTLEKLGLIVSKQGEIYHAIIPSYRPDLVCEADLAEEIARIYGYNRIEPSLLSGKQTTLGGRSQDQKTVEKIMDLMIGQGFYEACTYSFESPRQLDKLMAPADHVLRRNIQIQNPLGEDYSCMRTSMLPSLLEIASTNWNRSVEQARIFEIAYVYQPQSLPLTELPDEIQHLSAFIYDNDADSKSGSAFFALKGAAQELFLHLGLPEIRFKAEAVSPWMHPGQAATLWLGNTVIGEIGVIHPDVAANFNTSAQTAVLDILMLPILQNTTVKRRYKQLPRFPAVTRDLAILVSAEISSDALSDAIRSGAGPNLEQIKLFDIYQGQQVPSGKKSIAYNLVFRSLDRTLNEEDIQPVMQKILKQLSEKCQAVLRE